MRVTKLKSSLGLEWFILHLQYLGLLQHPS